MEKPENISGAQIGHDYAASIFNFAGLVPNVPIPRFWSNQIFDSTVLEFDAFDNTLSVMQPHLRKYLISTGRLQEQENLYRQILSPLPDTLGHGS